MDSVLKVGESGKEDPVFSVADHFCKTKAGAAIRSVPKGMCGCLERVNAYVYGRIQPYNRC